MMTTEAHNAVTQADTETSSAAVAYTPTPRRRGGPASHGPWAPASRHALPAIIEAAPDGLVCAATGADTSG
jgi:hypothetical protein